MLHPADGGETGAARWAPYTRFRAVLLISGFLPLLLVPLIMRTWPLPDHGVWNTSFIYVSAALHLGMTSFFYLDPEMREFRHDRAHLFFTLPIIIGLGVVFALSVFPAPAPALVNIAFAAWLGWHYTGQQVGIVAMGLKGEVATARLLSRERKFIQATALVTIVGLVRTVDLSSTPLRHTDLLLWCRIGFGALVVAALWLLVMARRNPPKGGGSWVSRAVALLWATAFVAPMAIVSNPIVGAATIATVHSFHYIFLVAYLSRSRRPLAWVGTVLVGAATSGLYVALIVWGPTEGLLRHAVPAATTAFVAAHRLVDMRVWRLREPERLGYMRRSFQFL